MPLVTLNPPLTDAEAWQVGQVLNYPYAATGSANPIPEGDDAARVDGSAFANRYMPPGTSLSGAKISNSFEMHIQSALVPPPGAPSVTAVSASSGAAISNGGTTSVHNALVKISLSGTGASAGNVMEIYNGATVSTLLGSPTVISAADISALTMSAFTGSVTSGGYVLTPRLAVSSGGSIGPAATNPWSVTVSG